MVSRPLRPVAAAALFWCCASGIGTGRAQTPSTTAQTPPTFRTDVDVVPVDVQVVDKAGQPVTGLSMEQFEVTINGRRRRVVSADLVDFRSAPAARPSAPAAPGGLPAAENFSAAALSAERRIYVLAVDAASFDEATARPVLRAAADFVRKLRAQDEVGLFAYPIGPRVDPTTDHDAISRALDTIGARRERPPTGRFNLSLSDTVELSRDNPMTSRGTDIVERICASEGPDCIQVLMAEVNGSVMLWEGIAQTGISYLRALVQELGRVDERKTVVLVSGGVVSADVPGFRPDSSGHADTVARTAAESNVNLYTLFIDQPATRSMAAEMRAQTSMDPVRDGDIQANWLGDVSAIAGGSLVRVATGDGTPAFDRVLAETSAYYLLGVEPAPEDRDGRPHELRVKVKDRSASVRGRSWVVVPKPGTPRRPSSSLAGAPATGPTTAPPAPALPPATPAVRALAEAFDRDDPAPLAAAIAPRNANLLLQAFRQNQSPWPASAMRTAVFALDLAIAGLRSDSPFTRAEATRLLGEYVVRVRQPASGDRFECAWFWSATSRLQGLLVPDVSTVVAERASDRCPQHGSLRLAHAVVKDQQLLLGVVPRVMLRAGSRPAGDAAMDEREREVLALYEAAAAFPEARYEARIRAAGLHLRAARPLEGLKLLENAPPPPADDAQLRYLGALIEGQLLRATGRHDEAAAAFRTAITVWPATSAARVALMSLLVTRGDSAGAAALAEELLTADSTAGDPWWLYYLGDYRAQAPIRAQLRDLVK